MHLETKSNRLGLGSRFEGKRSNLNNTNEIGLEKLQDNINTNIISPYLYI